MWLGTTMQPPVAGILSPSIQVREVAASMVGLIVATAKLTAQPRLPCTFRTDTRDLLIVAEQATRNDARIGPEMTPLPPPISFVVIVPVKPPARGKSRLDALPATQRRDLAAAFARDTVAAARRTPRVVAVLVVTDDFRFAAELARRTAAR